MQLPGQPHNILLIKSYSMGIGDLLRSSAAWAALKARWPRAQLHLLMFSNHVGYPSEDLIRSHWLLTSAHFVTVKQGVPGQTRQQKLPLAQVRTAIEQSLQNQPIDLVIDFETNGLKNPWLARWITRRKKAVSVGVAQFPLRGLFYHHAAPSSRRYQALHGLPRLMDYTEKDFVALAALGITRAGTRITLQPTAQAQAWLQTQNLQTSAGRKMVLLNIGCGTPDALTKRPDSHALADCLCALYASQAYDLHLSGAAFEQTVNSDFTALLQQRLQAAGLPPCRIRDWAGQLSLDQLSAVLQRADLAISSDSGPYHMAVALGVPTLCWFNFDTPPSYHHHPDVACLIRPAADAFVPAAQRLLAAGKASPANPNLSHNSSE